MATPVYTSSEGMRMVLQPAAPRITKQFAAPSLQGQAKPWGQPDFHSVLKPSMIRQMTGMPMPPAAPPVDQRLMQLRAQARVVSPTPQGRSQFKTYLKQRPEQFHNAPYASRSFSVPLNSKMEFDTSSMPFYNPFNDPHMQAYYARKLGVLARKKSPARDKKPQVIYSITVRTANQKKAGTTANVFLRMIGSKGKIAKQKLTSNKGLISTDRGKCFFFAPGSEHEFKLKGPDVGNLKMIIIEHDGLEERDSWFLEEIEIVQLKSEKSWQFPCHQWLSLYEDDCQISRELYPLQNSQQMQIIDYEIETVTGTKAGAGTDSNVFVTMYGKFGTTPRLQLHKPTSHSNPFERGHTDTFQLRTKNVGPLKKLRIEHDNTGMSAGWYLEQVVITCNRKSKTHFPCHQWLAKGEGDGRICRDLLPTEDDGGASHGFVTYDVEVVTGSKRGGGTDANVFVTLFGKDGDSGELQLKGSGNLFEKGATNNFDLKLPNLGVLDKLRIRHDNSGAASGWFLDRVTVTDTKTKEKYDFICNRWLAKDEEDGQICRLLTCSQSKKNVIPFEIRVTTGDKRQAGTDANVYIILHGGSSKKETDSGRIALEGGKFERSKVDVFNVEATAAVLPVKYITIGHDNKGAGAGWFLDKVTVFCSKSGSEQHFPCGKWLASDEGDGLIERDLYEDKSLRQKKEKLNAWDIFLHTSDVRNAGTDAKVYVALYGSKGKSDDIWLESEGDSYQRGQTDQFMIETPEIGRPYKLRVGHDGKGLASGWHLDSIELVQRSSGKKYSFACGRWLAKGEDDSEIVRELPATGESIKKPLPVVKYTVQVYTGNKSHAGTDADVFCCLYGEMGDTGDRSLSRSQNKNKFERGKMDEFTIEAVTLKQLKKLRIGHNGKGAGAGWYLEKIVVTEQGQKGAPVTFACNRWLAEDEDDGLIVRELFANGEGLLNTTRYQLKIKTGDVRNAGTNANVFVQVYGKHGESGVMWLKKSENTSDPFERGRTDHFFIETNDIGKLHKLKIGHDGKGRGSGWFLDDIEVIIPNRGETYRFAANRWLAEDEGDGEIEVELFPTEVKRDSAKIPYEVSIITGDQRSAGTDANVFVQIYGTLSKTEEFNLRNKSDNFERGATDSFKIEASDVGRITKIRIGHDNKGGAAGWFLETVKITKPVTKSPSSKRKRKQSTEDKRPSSRQSRKSIRKSPSLRSSSLPNKKRSSSTESHSEDDSDAEQDSDSVFDTPRSKQKTARRKSSVRKQSAVKQPPKKRSKSMQSGSDSDDSKRPPSRKSSTASAKSKGAAANRRPSSKKSTSKRRHSSLQSESGSDTSERSTKRKSSVGAQGRSKSTQQRPASRDSSNSESERGKTKKAARKSSAASSKSAGSADRRLSKKSLKRSISTKSDSGSESEDVKNPKHRKRNVGSSKSKPDVRRPSALSRKSTTKRHSQATRDPSSSESESSDSARTNKTYTKEKTNRKTHRKSDKSDSDNSSQGSKDQKRKSAKRRKTSTNSRHSLKDSEEGVETYYFVVKRWFDKKEDDGQIVRELVPTDEQGRPLADNEIEENDYEVHVFTGDVSGAGTDANIFMVLYGDHGDSGERPLKESQNRNKFERNQEDLFLIKAVDLGVLKKLKVWHDNKGAGAAWYLDKIIVDDKKANKSYTFPCEAWFDTKQGDGQICRDLLPLSKDQQKRLSRGQSVSSMKDELALEMKAATTTYNVSVATGKKRGAGTDANVYITLYGKEDNTGKIFLKHSKTNKNKFESGQVDEFVIEAVDIGKLKKIIIGHDNAGGFADWYLDSVTIEAASLGMKWFFPCFRWLAKDREDGQLERELFPEKLKTEKFDKCVPYEFTVFTSDKRSAGTDADVFVQLFGEDGESTRQISLCSNKGERKEKFNRGSVDKFVLELEELKGQIMKLRIGHDNSGFRAGWHLDHVTVKKLLEDGKSTVTYTFPCNQWFAKSEEDGAIVRDLAPVNIEQETPRKDGTVQKKKVERLNSETKPMKSYEIRVVTGMEAMAGTDANVYAELYGEHGDSGQLQLKKSSTNWNKFEKGQTDVFNFTLPDLGPLHRLVIGHDDRNMKSNWFLDHVEIADLTEEELYTFLCKNWIVKDERTGKAELSLYVEGYDERKGKLQREKSARGSARSKHSAHGSERGSAKKNRDTIPYTIKLTTGNKRHGGTAAPIWLRCYGSNNQTTGKIVIEKYSTTPRNGHPTRTDLQPGTTETFSVDGPDIGQITAVEINLDAQSPDDDWYLESFEVIQPTRGVQCAFEVHQWFSKSKGDGHVKRKFSVDDRVATLRTFKPRISHEISVVTDTESKPKANFAVWVQLFGANNKKSQPVVIGHADGRIFEPGDVADLKCELEDVGKIEFVRLGIESDSKKAAWLPNKIELTNKTTGNNVTYLCGDWLSVSGIQGPQYRDCFASGKDGFPTGQRTDYTIVVCTSDVRGAGTNANVMCTLIGEHGDSGELHLDHSETNRNPFERGQTDVFVFQDIAGLGDIYRLRIWHDDSGVGSAWHLDSVEVRDEKSKRSYQFPCGLWLSSTDDDQQICRELICSNFKESSKSGRGREDSDRKNSARNSARDSVKDTMRSDSKKVYEVVVTTGDKKDAGTLHHGFIVLCGKSKTSREYLLENSDKKKVLQRGQTDKWKVESKDLGELQKITIGHYPRNGVGVPKHPESDRVISWYCNDVSVNDLTEKKTYNFPVRCWIPISVDGKSSIDINVLNVETYHSKDESRRKSARSGSSMTYELDVVTGDERGAGTDANVSIVLYGSHGDSGIRPLKHRGKNLFERGQIDTFAIETADLGRLEKLIVEHDSSGTGSAWLLDRIEVRNTENGDLTVFPCGKWVEKQRGRPAMVELYAAK